MLADLKKVVELLLGEEVIGLEAKRPPEEVEGPILALLSGDLDERKRRELCKVLRDQPKWLTWLAEQIKNRRNTEDIR